VITTIHGDMDENLLEKKTGVVDNDNECITWVEYWLEGEYEVALRQWQAEHPDGEVSNGGQMGGYVHRSAHVTLKKPVFAFGEAAKLGE
jgi:hypothetical protein